MTTENVQDLIRFIRTREVGDKLDIATSQYANNTTRPGFSFDFHSTAPAVRSLIKRGYLTGDCGWRCYRVEVVKMPPDENDRNISVTMTVREARALLLAAGDIVQNEDALESVFVSDAEEMQASERGYNALRNAAYGRSK